MGSKGGSGGGSSNMGFQATTSTYTPNPEAMAAYRNSLGMAQNVAQIPYEAYPGQMNAGFTPDQLAAFQGTREMQGMAQPYINAGAGLINQAVNYSNPNNFNPAALSQYYNPYQQNVINATQATMAQQNAQQQNDLTARAIQQGAYGGDRSGVARAALMGQQALANQQVLSGLQSQGYQQAVNQFNQQQQQAINTAQTGAYSLGQLGLQGQQAALQGIQALLGTGGMQQQLAQQQLSAAYNQWLQERAYPYQQANFYSGIVSGIAPNMGGTTNTFGIGSGQQQTQQASGGGGGAGMLSSALSFLPMLMGVSDKDDKTDIQYLGKDPESGEKLYSYRYKGDPKSYPKVVGPMAQDIEEDQPERVREVGGHKIVEGLGHLTPSQREGRANGGSSIFSSPTVDPQAYQQAPYQADQRFDPGFQTGLNAIIDPAMADQIARQKWVSQQTQDQPEAVQEQLETRNPDFNLFPYFQDGAQSQSGFGSLDPEMRYSGGRVGMAEGGVGGLGDLIKQKTPFGAAAPYVEALPITPGRAHIPEPPKMNYLPGLPGGGGSGGGGGGGSQGGGGGMPKLPKMGKPSAAASAGSEGEAAKSAAAEEFPKSEASPETQTPPERPADLAPAAPEVSAADAGAAAPAPDAGGLSGLGGGLDNIFSGFGGMFGGFKHGGRVGYAGGGASGAGAGGGDAASAVGGVGSFGDAFPGALGSGHAGLPGLIGESGTGTLGSRNLGNLLAPIKGPMGRDPSYSGWLSRAMELDPGPQTTPEEQGQPSLPKLTDKMTPRPWMPGETQSQTQGNQNPGISPLLMAAMGGKGMTLAMASMGQEQAQRQAASEEQAKLQKQRADILASPMQVGGYGQTLQSNIVNPRTGLFNVGYKAYYVPHYDKGGRVEMRDGGNPNSFYNSIYNAILTAAKDRGAPNPEALARLGAAQSSLETGYGKHLAGGNNYFGIKGGSGPAISTQEVVDGRTINTKDRFRTYPSMQKSAEDYVRLVSSKPMYKNVYNAPTPEKAIAAQARSGYASDPKYGQKLSGIDARYAGSATPLIASSDQQMRVLKTSPVSLPQRGEQVAASDRPYPGSVLNRINPNDPSGPLLPESNKVYLGPSNTAPAQYAPISQPTPARGFNLAALNPIQPAMADDNVAAKLPTSIVPNAAYSPAEDRGLAAGTYVAPQLYGPSSLHPFVTDNTGFAGDPAEAGFIGGDIEKPGFNLPNLNRDMAGVRAMGFGDLPLIPFSKDETVSSDMQPRHVSPVREEHKALAEAEHPKGEKFFGDYRDFEPWKSDPIGGFFDKLTGDVPSSAEKGASMWDIGGDETAPASLGDIGDLFNFSQGGFVRNGYDGGGMPQLTDEDVFTPPEETPKGFELASAASPQEEVAAADRQPVRAQPQQPQQPQPGFENLLHGRNLMGGKMEFGPLSQAMLAAGMGMMASDRVNPLQAIGEGGLRGLEYYQTAKSAENASERQQIAQQNELAKLAETKRYHDLIAGKGSIGVIGYDAFGRPQYGWTTGPRAGTPRTSAEAAAASAGEVNWNKHGDEFLEQIPPEYHEQIKAIAEGRGVLPAGFATGKNPLYRMVTTYDPNFNMATYKQKSNAITEYSSTSPSKAGGQLIAANTGLAHLGEVSDAAQRLNNSQYRDVNWLSQAVRSHMPGGIPEVKDFEAAKQLALTEISKYYKGGTPAEGEIRRELSNLDAADTPQELNRVIYRLGSLMQGKSEALEHNWENVMGKNASFPTPELDLYSDPAKSAWERIQERASGKTDKGGSLEALAKKYNMTVEQLKDKYEQMKKGRQ